MVDILLTLRLSEFYIDNGFIGGSQLLGWDGVVGRYGRGRGKFAIKPLSRFKIAKLFLFSLLLSSSHPPILARTHTHTHTYICCLSLSFPPSLMQSCTSPRFMAFFFARLQDILKMYEFRIWHLDLILNILKALVQPKKITLEHVRMWASVSN